MNEHKKDENIQKVNNGKIIFNQIIGHFEKVVIVILAISAFFAAKFTSTLNEKQLTTGIIITIAIVIAVFLSSFIAYLIFRKRKYDKDVEICFRERYTDLATAAKKLYEQEQAKSINDYEEYQNYKGCVVTTEELCKLEMKVGNEFIKRRQQNYPDPPRIYIFTSKFVLEGNDLRKIVIDNIRNGVIYYYIIPNSVDDSVDDYIGNFREIVYGWFCDLFGMFSTDNDKIKNFQKSIAATKKDTNWCPKYKSIIESYPTSNIRLFNEKRLLELFKDSVEFLKTGLKMSCKAADYFYATVIMYQMEKERDKPNSWTVLLKLPTGTGKDYNALQLDSQNPEKKELIDCIKKYCKETKDYKSQTTVGDVSIEIENILLKDSHDNNRNWHPKITEYLESECLKSMGEKNGKLQTVER